MEKLKNSRVAIFGLGGVGGYVGEALVRSGIGSFDLIDNDKICLTNLNRQIIATFDTVGQYKTDVMKERMLKINPKVNIQTYQCLFLPENASDFSFEDYDYIIDAVDTASAKIELVLKIIFLLFQVWELEIKLILPNLKSQIFIKQKYVL